jgi:large subunit ribosomal protein L10
MKAFWVENEAYAAEEIGRLADLPTKEELYSQVVAAVEAPFAELVGSIDGFFRELVGSIDALAEKKKAEE